MQKQAPPIFFSPLPVSSDEALYFDRSPVPLPFAQEIRKLHYHDRYEIGLCEEGEGVFLFEDGAASITKGDVVFLAPNSRHYSRSLRQEQLCYCRFVYVEATVIEELMHTVCKDSDRAKGVLQHTKKFISPILSPSQNPKEAALLTELVESCREGRPDLFALVELRLTLFLLEAHDAFTHTTAPLEVRQEPDSRITAAAEYLSIHYDQNNSISELAELCNLSESQLRRRFIALYGLPPAAYRNRLRCTIAAALLEKTQMSIWEAAYHVGYADVSDFYRAFKKHYGMAPSAYRAGLRNGPAKD